MGCLSFFNSHIQVSHSLNFLEFRSLGVLCKQSVQGLMTLAERGSLDDTLLCTILPKGTIVQTPAAEAAKTPKLLNSLDMRYFNSLIRDKERRRFLSDSFSPARSLFFKIICVSRAKSVPLHPHFGFSSFGSYSSMDRTSLS